MAYTDAISVACKALGVGADVYWQADRTKYDQQQKQQQAKQEQAPKNKAKLTAIILANEAKAKQLYDFIKQSEAKAEQMLDPVNLLRQYYDFGDELKESIYKLYNQQQQ